MNFLYPSFLFGLFAVSIPILIHLFNLQKPKKVLFPNVRFLKQVQQSTSNKLKLKHLLILAARICFILFLVLCFAQPFILNKDLRKLKGKPFVSLYVDNSFSMQNELGQDKGLDIGIKSVQKLIELFPAASSYGFLTNDFEGKDQYFRNKDKINERLSELNFSSNYRTGASILKRQEQGFEGQGAENKHVVLFSDFQKSTMSDFSKVKFDSTIQYHFVPIQNSEISNVSIDSVWLSIPLVKAGENNTLQVHLLNSGSKEVRELTLKLYIDNIQVSSASVDIKPSSSAEASFIFNINGEGQKKVSIRFEDYPVIFDNEYFLILNVSPKINILHLFEDDGSSISSVYANESVFEALNSKAGDFDYSKIDRANLIVFDGVKTITPALLQPLKAFVEKGGSLVLFPGKEVNESSYKDFALQMQLQVPEFVKPDTSNKSSFEFLPPDFSNPFFNNVFEKKDLRMAMPFAFPVIRWKGNGASVFKFKNAETFLSSNKLGKGMVYLASTPLNDVLTNLHRHSIFVPLMYKIAFNSIVSTEQLSYSFQDPLISVALGDELKNLSSVYSLESDNLKLIPSQRISSGSLLLELPTEQMKAGFYDLKINGKIAKTIAVNYGKDESKMATFSIDELKKMTENNKNVKVYSSDTSDQFADSFRKENIGTPLWRYFLLGALLFLLVEIVLIRFL